MDDTPQDRPTPLGWFAHLRGVLVALHLVAITLLALPAVGEGMNRWAWKDPTVQEEFAWWTGRFNDCGIAVTPDELENDLWETASAYESVRGRALAPFGRYYAYCATYQSWRMFAGPHRYPSRLHIDLEEDGTWRPIYVKSDPHYTWLSEQLDHYRMRPFLYRLSWYRYNAGIGDFDRFADWVGQRAAHDFPTAQRIRVSFLTVRTPSPEEVMAGTVPKGEAVLDAWRELGERR